MAGWVWVSVSNCVCVCDCIKVIRFGFGFGFAKVMNYSHTIFTLRFLYFSVVVYILCLFITVRYWW